MVAEQKEFDNSMFQSCSLAKISMVAEQSFLYVTVTVCCSLAKISMVAEHKQAER